MVARVAIMVMESKQRALVTLLLVMALAVRRQRHRGYRRSSW